MTSAGSTQRYYIAGVLEEEERREGYWSELGRFFNKVGNEYSLCMVRPEWMVRSRVKEDATGAFKVRSEDDNGR